MGGYFAAASQHGPGQQAAPGAQHEAVGWAVSQHGSPAAQHADAGLQQSVVASGAGFAQQPEVSSQHGEPGKQHAAPGAQQLAESPAT